MRWYFTYITLIQIIFPFLWVEIGSITTLGKLDYSVAGNAGCSLIDLYNEISGPNCLDSRPYQNVSTVSLYGSLSMFELDFFAHRKIR